MFRISLLLLIARLFSEISGFVIQLNQTKLTNLTIKSFWRETLSQHFPSDASQEVTGIEFKDMVIDQHGFNKLFQYNLSQLKHLNFSKVNMNSELMHQLMKQPFIKNLQIVELEESRLQPADFQGLSGEVSWKYLHLGKNILDEKLFQHLSKLSMNLTSLKLSGSYLGEGEIAQALIDIGLQRIEYLYLDRTAVSDENMLTILKACNTSNIKNLSIGANNYDLSFYQEFAKMDFRSLKMLNLGGLLIDQDGTAELVKMKFPSIEDLIISNNFMRTIEGKILLKKQIMPNLNSLKILTNPMDGYLFKHLEEEGFILKSLEMDIIVECSKSLEYLSRMNLSELQKLRIMFGSYRKGDVENFLKKTDLSKLKQFSFIQNKYVGNILHNLVSIKLINLEKLELDEIGKVAIQEFNRSSIFPKLKKFDLDISDKSQQFAMDFVLLSKVFAPELETLSIQVNPAHLYSLFQKLKNGQITTHSRVRIQINFDIVVVELQPDRQPSILAFDYQTIWSLYIYELDKHSYQDYQQWLQKKEKIKQQVMEGLNFNNLSKLVDQRDCQFFQQLLSSQYKANITQYLESLTIKQTKNQCLILLQSNIFPSLTFIQVNIDPQLTQQSSNITFSNLTYLNTLEILIMTGNGSDSSNIAIQFLKAARFGMLSELTLSLVGLRNQDLVQITGDLINEDRIKLLNIQSNMLQNISQITQNFILQSFFINGNLLGQQTSQLCNMNLRFMNTLEASQCDIGNEDLLKFLSCKQTKERVVFPNMQYLSFDYNYIETSGTRKLFQIGLPMILQFDLAGNKDFQYFNTIFGSTYSKRIAFFLLQSIYIESISGDLPKQNVRRLLSLILMSSSFRDVDFTNLAKLEFMQLAVLGLLIQNSGECQSLKNIRKMSKNLIYFVLILEDPLPTLDSLCLTPEPFVSEIRPSTFLFFGPGWYHEVGSFVDSYINPGQYLVSYVINHFACPSQQKMLSMLKTSDLSDLQQFQIDFCDQINDEIMRNLLNQPMQQLQSFKISGSEHVTSHGFSNMQNLTYPSLISLDFSKTSFGDKAMEYLVTNRFPELTTLNLVNVDITQKGLKLLEKLYAPKLEVMDLSSNEFDPLELKFLDFSLERFPYLQSILLFPQLQEDVSRQIEAYINLNRQYKIISIESELTHSTDEQQMGG